MLQFIIRILAYLLMTGFIILFGYIFIVLITMPFTDWWKKPTTVNGRRSIY